ncbi:MAG: DegV family protein [Oscillospiraceae bacterium]|jgi:DegV family protein with EDD domain|nr:DegV family protein [Oscillospiraceae bacterium]
MENPVVITVDSAADMPPELIEKYNVSGISPLHVLLDGKDYRDGEDIEIWDIFKTYSEKKILPTTSAVSIDEYKKFFKKFTDDGASVIHISLSSGISCTYQNACIAAADLNETGAQVYAVDSLSLTLGILHLVIKAAEMRDEGKSAREIAQELEVMVPKIDSSFVLNTLEFLKAGGRCSALTAFGANVLGIKPSIEMRGGKMEIGKKYRGKLEAVHIQYIDDRLASGDFDAQRVIVAHTGLSDERLELIVRHLKKTAKFKEIIVNICGCVISAHGAKDAMAILLLRK